MDPNLTGFTNFLRNSVVIPTSALPNNSPYIPAAFNYAMNVAYSGFQALPNADPTQDSLYATLVYNLGTHTIVSLAIDQPGQTYFSDLRTSLKLNSAFGGIITSASDEGTSASAVLPEWVQRMTLDEFDLIKSPWGRIYLKLAQKPYADWGIS